MQLQKRKNASHYGYLPSGWTGRAKRYIEKGSKVVHLSVGVQYGHQFPPRRDGRHERESSQGRTFAVLSGILYKIIAAGPCSSGDTSVG